MNATMEFDVGPLNWVKNEIDLALERAISALDQFSAGAASRPADAAQIRFCRTHLHQVHGALAIVGLDGVTQFAEALENLLEAIENETLPASESLIGLTRKSLMAIGLYLTGLINGQPHQPLRLWPIYQEIQEERGVPRSSATDLFFPDLSARPPRQGMRVAKLEQGELPLFLRRERGRFQRGLLAWLRAHEDGNGIGEMLAAAKHIGETQETGSMRALWWVAEGLLTVLAEGGFPDETGAKLLLARVDLQIRRLIEGSRNVAERLMREALYLVAKSASATPLVGQIKETYRLDALLPAADDLAVPDAAQAAASRLREVIVTLGEAWNKFCAGSASSLQVFRENAATMSGLVGQLGHTDYRRLAQAIVATANWLSEAPSRHSDALAMELATTILLAQNAQKNYPRLGADFAHQVDVIVERIHACIAGHPPQPGSEIPLLDEMSRKAQEKLLIGQVAKEIQSNLVQIEQELDSFFSDPEKHAGLVNLDRPFRQVIGAFTMLCQEGAAAALQDCLETVRRFAEPGYAATEGEFEQLASQLSMLGFFVEALPRGVENFENFVHQLQASPRAADEEAEDDVLSVEQEVVQSRRETHALLEALREQPRDTGLREEIRQNLEILKSDADLIADARLGEQAKAMLGALASDGTDSDIAPHIEQGMAALKPEIVETAPPSAETLELSQASNEEIDAELLDIFLQEAKEVLSGVETNLGQLKKDMYDGGALTTVRRSFHTLKGSGRMVGLKDLGETAWAIEQTLNLWLRLELAADTSLVGLLDEAYDLFSSWVRYLETQEGQAPDPRDLIVYADSLRLSAENGLDTVAPVEETPEEASASQAEELADFAGESAEEAAPTETADGEAELIQIDCAPVSEEETTDILNMSVSDEESLVLEEEEAPTDLQEEPPVAEVIQMFPARPVESAPEPEPKNPAGFEARGQRISISPALFAIFSEEARTYLNILRRELPAIESEEALPTPRNMYRAAHTLAGISATVGLLPINQVGSALEHALQRRDDSEQAGSLQAAGTIRWAIAELESMFASLKEQRNIDLLPGLVEELDNLYPVDATSTTSAVEAIFEEPAEKAVAGAEEEAMSAPESPESPDLPEETPPEMPAEAVWLAAPEKPMEPPPPATPPPQAPALVAVRDEIDEQLLPIFLEEAVELNEGIAVQLRAWRADPANAEVVHVLARQLHTFKGSARMAGAMTLGEITHALETRVDEASHVGAVSAEVIDDIENTFESVRQIVERLQRGETLDPVAVDPVVADPVADDPVVANLVAADPVMAEPVVEPAAESSDTTAAAAPLPAVPPQALPERTVERRSASRSTVRAEEMEGEAAQAQVTLRVKASVVDRLVNDAGELSIARSRIEGEMRSLKESMLDLTESVIRLRRLLRDIDLQAEMQMQSRTASLDDDKHPVFDPLEFDRFTRFQELTRMMAESVNDVSTVQQHLLKGLDDANAAIVAQARQNREVQQELMSMRMMPFDSLADRLYRVVRQAAKDLDKRANLEIKGGQTELDRSVLDKIAVPLEHLLRNAVAHGIEKRAERAAAGKPEIGEISLSLKQDGNEIVLLLSDDGAGLDFGRIRARAVAAGLLGEDEAIDEARLADFIFAPGFSTAEALSKVAGRGVGMDVVRTDVATLGGRVEVESTSGQGTEFRLILPLTLVVIKALLIRAGSTTFAIPSSMIEQVLNLKEADANRIRDEGAAEWQERRYPFSYLPHLLGDLPAQPEQRRQYWILLLRSGTRRIAIQVDELRGNQEIVVKNIGPQLARVIGVDGATVLGNGQVVLILNPVALSTRPAVTILPEVEAAAPEEESLARRVGGPALAALPTIMVVDDSLTVRKVTGRLMAREGYQVALAKDGVEALEKLFDFIPDAMLVDIEMPRMDGFELVRNIRANESLKYLPIIMITSRTAEKHRNYAFELGVNHYLGKPYQEEELLSLIAGYVANRDVI